MTTPNEKLIRNLTIKAGVMEMGEKIAWGSDTALMRQAAHALQSQAERIATQDAEIERLNTEIRLQYAHDTIEIDTLRAELAEIAAAEPVAYRWVWKSKPWDIEGWCYTNTPPTVPELQEIEPLFTRPMPAQDVEDAERYRWLREQHWSTDTIAVVLNPKQAVKLGYVCPSDSLLDETIDAARAKGAK